MVGVGVGVGVSYLELPLLASHSLEFPTYSFKIMELSRKRASEENIIQTHIYDYKYTRTDTAQKLLLQRITSIHTPGVYWSI